MSKWNNSKIKAIPADYDPTRHGAALLFFSMDTCPWCQRLKPTMETVAGTLGSVVPVYSVGPEHPLTEVMGVSGFPTIKYVDGMGTTASFEGARTADAIMAFVCNHAASRLSVCTKYGPRA